MSFLPYILLLGTMYGTTLIASRFLLGDLDSTFYLTLRLLISSLAYLLLYLVRPKTYPFPKKAKTWRLGTIFGVLSTILGMNLILFGMRFVSGGLASILISLGPAITVVLAHWFLKEEKISKTQIVGVGVAFLGATFMVLSGESGLGDTGGGLVGLGYLMIITGKLIGSAAIIYQRRFMSECDTFQVTSISMFVSTIFSIGWVLLTDKIQFGVFTMTHVLVLFYAALIGTFLAQILNFFITKKFGAMQSSITQYVIPIVASVAGVLFLKEKISLTMLIGMATILLGIAIVNSNGFRPLRKKLFAKF